ncbi:hypothetical protein H8959_022621, partial [Pygathrix nigripes]
MRAAGVRLARGTLLPPWSEETAKNRQNGRLLMSDPKEKVTIESNEAMSEKEVPSKNIENKVSLKNIENRVSSRSIESKDILTNLQSDLLSSSCLKESTGEVSKDAVIVKQEKNNEYCLQDIDDKLSGSAEDDDEDDTNEEDNDEDSNPKKNTQAPLELMAEFLRAEMAREYQLAKKLCQMREHVTRAHGTRCEVKPTAIGNIVEFGAKVLYHEVLRVHKRQRRIFKRSRPRPRFAQSLQCAGPRKSSPHSSCFSLQPVPAPDQSRTPDSRGPGTTELMASSTPSSSATSSNAGADPNTTNLRPTTYDTWCGVAHGCTRKLGLKICGFLQRTNSLEEKSRLVSAFKERQSSKNLLSCENSDRDARFRRTETDFSNLFARDLLPAKNGEEQTVQFLLEVVDILLNYVRKTFDRSTKVLDFHHPHQLLEGMEGFNLELSDHPESLEQILVDCRDTLKYGVRTGHPRFFNQLSTGLDIIGLAGEWLTSTANTNMFTYEIAPVFVLMEQITLKKMREIVGWSSKDGDGIFSP